ncbi:MAG: threonine aldolase family protein [Aeoliella sp.]
MIDLRSDTVTKPTPGMREAMASADVGDDVFGEDPTINALEARVADLLGKQAALFVSSGTMGNQLGIRAHCQPGDEFLCEAECHIYRYEQAAYAQLFGVATQPIETPAGLPTWEQAASRIRGSDPHEPRTRLLCLENTHNRHGGIVLDYDGVAALCSRAAEAGLATHLDGARLWNACAATGRAPADWAQHFDTVSVCFSKGLGAPVGSALAGPRDLIAQAHRTRKALGGGMRQSGILAAGAIYALDHHLPMMAADHEKANRLRDAIENTKSLTLALPRSPNPDSRILSTNLVFFDVDPAWGTGEQFCTKLSEQGVQMLPLGPQRVRAVTHLGVSMEEVEEAAVILIKITPR